MCVVWKAFIVAVFLSLRLFSISAFDYDNRRTARERRWVFVIYRSIERPLFLVDGSCMSGHRRLGILSCESISYVARTVYNSFALTTKKHYLVVDVNLLYKTSPGVDSKWFS